MQTVVPTHYTTYGVDIDANYVVDRKDINDIKRQVGNFVLNINEPKKKTTRTLFSMKLGYGFDGVANPIGYYASFYPEGIIHPDILNRNKAFGQLVALAVEPQTKFMYDAAKYDMAFKWACGEFPERSFDEGPSVNILGSYDGKSDIKPWQPRIIKNGFAGVYCSSVNPSHGLVVVYSAGCLDSQKRYDAIKNLMPENRPTFRTFLTDPKESAMRNLNRRNADRILYDITAAIGLEKYAACAGVEDIQAAINPTSLPPVTMEAEYKTGIPKTNDLSTIVAALRPRPWRVIPTIRNESDFFEMNDSGNIVSYYNGVVSVNSAKDSLVFLVDGSHEKGLYVCPREKYIQTYGTSLMSSRMFDFGQGIASKNLETPTWLKEISELYVHLYSLTIKN